GRRAYAPLFPVATIEVLDESRQHFTELGAKRRRRQVIFGADVTTPPCDIDTAPNLGSRRLRVVKIPSKRAVRRLLESLGNVRQDRIDRISNLVVQIAIFAEPWTAKEWVYCLPELKSLLPYEQIVECLSHARKKCREHAELS